MQFIRTTGFTRFVDMTPPPSYSLYCDVYPSPVDVLLLFVRRVLSGQRLWPEEHPNLAAGRAKSSEARMPEISAVRAFSFRPGAKLK
jgi:hypothetical protein